MNGKLYVISGPSGAGKGTICQELKKVRDYYLSISMTTRAPRGTEQNGVEYFFVTNEEFEREIRAGGFLEYTKTYDRYYGTPRKKAEEQMKSGKDVVLEIDVKGGAQVKKTYPEANTILILPPSIRILHERLKNRGTETEEAIRTRMSIVLDEIRRLEQYDYYVVNDDLETAVRDVVTIMNGNGQPVSKEEAKKLIAKYEQEESLL